MAIDELLKDPRCPYIKFEHDRTADGGSIMPIEKCFPIILYSSAEDDEKYTCFRFGYYDCYAYTNHLNYTIKDSKTLKALYDKYKDIVLKYMIKKYHTSTELFIRASQSTLKRTNIHSDNKRYHMVEYIDVIKKPFSEEYCKTFPVLPVDFTYYIRDGRPIIEFPNPYTVSLDRIIPLTDIQNNFPVFRRFAGQCSREEYMDFLEKVKQIREKIITIYIKREIDAISWVEDGKVHEVFLEI